MRTYVPTPVTQEVSNARSTTHRAAALDSSVAEIRKRSSRTCFESVARHAMAPLQPLTADPGGGVGVCMVFGLVD